MCKKRIVWVLVAVLFSGVAMAELDDSGRLIVPETSVAPVIDGELDDVWQGVGEEGVLITEIINATSAIPEDANDLSATFRAMYDDDNIYMYVVVRDSVLDYTFSDWQGDGVEIFFDGDNSKGSSYDGVNDNQIRITVDDVNLPDINSSLPVEGTEFNVLLTDVGYNIEASFPLAALQIVPENTFGFEVQVNDNDDGSGRETMIRWFSNDNNSWRDASLFGEAVLVPAPEPEPVDPGSDGLVAYYTLDNDANDSSGNGNDGTLISTAASWMPDDGMVDGALSFDGTASNADRVEIPTADISPAAGTIAMWGNLKPDPQAPDTRYFFGHTTIPPWSNRIQLYMDSADTTLDLGLGDSHNRHKDIEVLATETWYHVALTWDNGNYVVYVNGEEKASGEYTGLDTLNAVADIGNDGRNDETNRTEAFNGLLDDVWIYGRALSEGEVLYLAGYRVVPVDPGSDSLVAHWPLDEGAGDTAADIVGGHDGTLKGGVTWAGEGSPVSGEALSFDGYSDGVHHATDPGTINWVSVDPFDVVGSGITLAAWIRPDGFDIGDARIITKQKSWSSIDIWWMLSTYTDGTALRMRLKTDDGGADGGTTTMFSDTGYLEAGVWSHVTATYDGSKMRLYHNAVEIMNTDKTGAIQTDPNVAVAIGNSPLSDPGGLRATFHGLIDDVRTYSRGLSEGEILYLAGHRVNLLQNPSFEEDEAILDDPDWAQWCTWNPAEGAGSNATIVDTESLDGARSLRIEPKGTENWHFIVLYLPILVDMDKNYDISFWAKAEAPRPLTVQLKAEDNSINAWGATDFDLTTEWAEYSYTSEVLIDVVKLEICCSGTEDPFWLDLVSITEGF